MSIVEDLADGNADTAFAIGRNFPIRPREIPKLPRTATIQSPAENPAIWKAVYFQAHAAPGKWKVSGIRARTIEQPKKKGTDKNTLLDQGIAPGEVDFEVETWTGQQLRDLQDFYNAYLSPDRALKDANVTIVAYPALHVRNIKQVYGFKATIPEPQGDRGDVRIISKFTAKVFTEKTKIGGQGTRKPKGTPAAGGNAGSSRIDVLLEAAQTGALLLFGLNIGESADVQGLLRSAGVNVDSLGLQAPAATSPVILPYREATALSIISGSIPDTMVADQSMARAPR